MKTFEQFVQELDKFPKIDTFCVKDDNEDPALFDGKIVEAQQIKIFGKTKDEAEQTLMSLTNDLIEGKQVWIRVMPYVKEINDTDGWEGRIRVAVL